MSHWSTDLIIDNIRDVLESIQALEAELESLYGAGLVAAASDVYSELTEARKRLCELEQSIAL
jgi:hypothetical protein